MRKVVTRISDGLGNQLFQFALGERVSKESGRKHALDVTHFAVMRWFGSAYCRRSYLLDRFAGPSKACKWSPILAWSFFFVWSVRTFCGKRLADAICRILRMNVIRPRNPFSWDPDYVNRALEMDGTLYFSACYGFVPLLPPRTELRRMFAILDPIGEDEIRYVDLMSDCDSVSVHVRRTDYLTAGDGCNVLDRAYYEGAMRLILDRYPQARFFFFSDDLEWCRTAYADVPNAVFVSLERADERPWLDLRLMSRCRHHIIANSTFAWWGATLSAQENGMTVYPENWFWNLRTPPEMVYPTWIPCPSFLKLRAS